MPQERKKYKYSSDDLRELFLKRVANNERHAMYASNVALAKKWHMINSGQGQGEVVIKRRSRESDAQKEQRVRLYNTRTREVVNKLKTTAKEVDRCDNIKDIIKYKDNASKQKSLEKIVEREKNFYGEDSVDKYLDDNYMDWNVTDANAFLLVDFFDFDNKKDNAWSYPSIISSENTRDFEYYAGTLQYLMVDRTETVEFRAAGENTPKQTTDVKVYWCYGHEKAWKISERVEGQIDKEPEGQEIDIKSYERKEYEVIGPAGSPDNTKIKIEPTSMTKRYILEEIENDPGVVPARQFGHFLNPETKNQNYNSMFSPATELFMDLMDKKCSYDIHLALHGIAQKFVYVGACTYTDPVENVTCSRGKINDKTCSNCKGSGKMPLHRSEQDIITLELKLHGGEDASEIIDMSKLVHYAEIPKHIIEMHRDEVSESVKLIGGAIFNNHVAVKEELTTKTATEIQENKSPVNNVLHQYARGKAAMYCFIIKQIARYMDLEKDLIVSREYPSDFRLYSVSELLTMRSQAINASAPQHIVQSIDDAILSKQNMGEPETVARVRVRERFRPFNDRSESERQSSLSLLPTNDLKRILYLYFDDIFSEIENNPEYKDFWTLEYKKQKEKVDILAGAYLEIYKANSPEVIDIPVTGEVDDEDDDTDNDSEDPANEANGESKLRSQVGGVNAVIDINKEVATGKIDRNIGIEILILFHGFERSQAERLIGQLNPKLEPTPANAA